MLTAAIIKIHSGNYDTSTVYELDLTDLGLTDISKLSSLCPDLISLDLSGNKLNSLSGIEGLGKLEKLVLDRTCVPLTGISSLVSLQSLSLRDCGISVLSAIKPDDFGKLKNLHSLDLRNNPVCTVSTLPQYIRGINESIRQLNGEYLLFPKFDNTPLQTPPSVSFTGPDQTINFDDVEARLKGQMDEVNAAIADCNKKLSEAEALVHKRLKDVKAFADSVIASSVVDGE